MAPDMRGRDILLLTSVVADGGCVVAAFVNVAAERLLPGCDRTLGGALAPARQ
jgi:hypothetical protein